MITNDDQNNHTNRAKLYMCICGKKYKFRQGLHVHRKKSCTYTEGDIIDAPMEPVKEDSDKVEFCKEIFPCLKAMMLEIMPKIQSTTINTTNYNNIYQRNIWNFKICTNE